MKKIVLLFILFFLMCLPVCSFVLKGAVSYSVDTARLIAFENVEYKIDISKYTKFIYDINNEQNLNALKKGKTKYRGKKLTKFADGIYSVRYLDNSLHTFYYHSNGNLQALAINETGEYPIKSIKYDSTGKLDAIALYISGKEQYIFDYSGKLIGHWVSENCYNEKGELVMTRK